MPFVATDDVSCVSISTVLNNVLFATTMILMKSGHDILSVFIATVLLTLLLTWRWSQLIDQSLQGLRQLV